MPTTFQTADDEVGELIGRVMESYHPRLKTAEVKIGAVYALNPDGDAVTRGGYGVLGKIGVVSLKDRLSKGYDAELLIDEKAYGDLSEAQRAAFLDHMLSHLDTVDETEDDIARAKFVQGEEGEAQVWKTDDLGRPKLKTVKGDWNVGDGFAAVVSRHGEAAIEYENIRLAKGRADAAAKASVNGSAKQTSLVDHFAEGLPEGTEVTIEAGGKKATIKGRKKGKGK